MSKIKAFIVRAPEGLVKEIDSIAWSRLRSRNWLINEILKNWLLFPTIQTKERLKKDIMDELKKEIMDELKKEFLDD